MKILLTKDVKGLGRSGDVKEVSDGHARNFLIPKKLGIPATETMVNQVKKEASEKQAKAIRDEQKLQDLIVKLNKAKLILKGKASKDHLFAAIHEQQITEAINQKFGLELDPKYITIPNPIKTLGPATAEIKLTPQHKALINLEIQAQ